MFQTLQWLNKNQEAIKSTQLQQCTTDICQLYGLNWQSDILKIPHGFNFFKDLTNDFMG